MGALPPELNVEKYLAPPEPQLKCRADMTNFDSYQLPPTGPVKLPNGNVWKPEPGYIVSECEFVKIVNLKAEHARLVEEKEAFETVRTRERELWGLMEAEYNSTILALQRENNTWWVRNSLVIGLAAGIVGTGFVALALH